MFIDGTKEPHVLSGEHICPKRWGNLRGCFLSHCLHVGNIRARHRWTQRCSIDNNPFLFPTLSFPFRSSPFPYNGYGGLGERYSSPGGSGRQTYSGAIHSRKQWRRQGGEASAPRMGGRPKLCNMCVLSLSWVLRPVGCWRIARASVGLHWWSFLLDDVQPVAAQPFQDWGALVFIRSTSASDPDWSRSVLRRVAECAVVSDVLCDTQFTVHLCSRYEQFETWGSTLTQMSPWVLTSLQSSKHVLQHSVKYAVCVVRWHAPLI